MIARLPTAYNTQRVLQYEKIDRSYHAYKIGSSAITDIQQQQQGKSNHSLIARSFYKMTWIALYNGRPIRKWNSMLPNVFQWGWPGTSLAIKYTSTSLYINKLWNRFDPPNTLLTITDDLEWGQHVSEISCKATKTLGFFLRNLALVPRHLKEVAYKTLVCPQLKYAAPIWHHYNETATKKVEKVQKTAASWTCRRWRNKSIVDDVLGELEWPSLEDRRVKSSLTFFYKIHSGTVLLDKDRYLTPAPNFRRTMASHDPQYTRYMAYSDALKNSFFPRTIPLWNSLPSSVVSSKVYVLVCLCLAPCK